MRICAIGVPWRWCVVWRRELCWTVDDVRATCNVLPCVLSVYLANGGGWVIMRSWPQPYKLHALKIVSPHVIILYRCHPVCPLRALPLAQPRQPHAHPPAARRGPGGSGVCGAEAQLGCSTALS